MAMARFRNLGPITMLPSALFHPKVIPPKQTCAPLLRRRLFATSCAIRQDVFNAQMEDPVSSAVLNYLRSPSFAVRQTLTEKIVQKSSVDLPEGKKVQSGDYVFLKPSRVMTHDNSWPVAMKFMSIGASKVHDPSQLVMTLDHDVQNQSDSNLKKYRQIQAFAKKQGVDFFGAGRGIGHQIMIEEGYCWPNEVCVASDSHSNMYGGVGTLGTPVVRTDAASIWSTGRTWWQIPPIARVTLKGVLPKGVTGKDVIVALCGLFNNDEVLNHAIEFTGSEEALRSLSIDDRLAIANMTTEWGALSGLFPVDSVLIEYLRYKATRAALFSAWNVADSDAHLRFTHERIDQLVQNPVSADRGAKYQKELYLDLSSLSPYVSGPNSVKLARPLHQLESENIRIDKAYLVSCTNSRASDLAAAAKVFKEEAEATKQIPKVPEHVQFYIAAASLPEQQIAEAEGDWQTLIDAGAIPLPSGCGPCIGLGRGLLEKGEVGISASNRNFKGRMGSVEAQAYLSSPEVVAASALHGKICGPRGYQRPEGTVGVVKGEGTGIEEGDRVLRIEDALENIIKQADPVIAVAEGENLRLPQSHGPKETIQGMTEILPGFPEKIQGEIIFCDGDNINTDGIYPGKYTYQDGVSQEKMASVCMENYDPSFSSIAREGDILVSGFNFGCGSSREQAATAILAKKLPLVVAGSFGNIFSRNSINNALLGLELPGLVRLLRNRFSKAAPKAEGPVIEPDLNKESLDSPPPAPVEKPETEKVLTRRTGYHFLWDVRRSMVEVKDGEGRVIYKEKVGEMPPNVQEIIACGGLENWVKKAIGK